MSEGGGGDQGPPKLYAHKPRKAQLKQVRGQQNSNDFSSPPGMGTHATAPPPPPSAPPKVPFVRRYKYLWPMLLAVNLGVGAYLFTRTKKKDIVGKEQEPSPVSVKDTTAHVAETPVSPPPIANPVVIKRDPIPEDQQRELFKWILEEKRKVKPKDAEEKRRIDEEKALLKSLIRSKSIPSIK